MRLVSKISNAVDIMSVNQDIHLPTHFCALVRAGRLLYLHVMLIICSGQGSVCHLETMYGIILKLIDIFNP